MATIPYRFLVRGGTAANLEAVNEIPLHRELVIATDTGVMKLGNGTTPYNDLPVLSGGGGGGGSAWLVGTTVPGSGLGVDGDLYLRTTTGDVYQKTAGAWSVVANIVGPEGEQGAQGEQGEQGDQGPPGSSSGQLSLGAGDRVNAVPIGIKALTPVTFACVLKSYILVVATKDGNPGSVSVDLRAVSYADYALDRPNSGDSVLPAPLQIINGAKADGDATSWTDAVPAGTILAMVVQSRSANVVHVALAVETEKSS